MEKGEGERCGCQWGRIVRFYYVDETEDGCAERGLRLDSERVYERRGGELQTVNPGRLVLGADERPPQGKERAQYSGRIDDHLFYSPTIYQPSFLSTALPFNTHLAPYHNARTKEKDR
jgi:hypothetical protein